MKDAPAAPAAPAAQLLAEGKTWKEIRQSFKAKGAKTFAVKHTGPPAQYNTEHGTETAYDGDYVVEVGDLEQVQHVPPTVAADGKRTPGEVRTVKVPKLEVVKAQDFEALYESA